jgi:dienelactone hydrolase
MKTKNKILLGLLTIVLVGSVAAYLSLRTMPPDTRYTGAYRLDDGALVYIAPRDDGQLRFKRMDGSTGTLWPTGNYAFEGGAGWAEREPVVNRIRFEMDGSGRPTGFTWTQGEGAPRHATAMRLREQVSMFPSGQLQLRAKLVLPEGSGPFPAVVIVHGSGSESAVDFYAEPYLYASNGFAALVFDKRGTGDSQGKYLQNFHVLSDDVVAALRWLRTQPAIDATRIHLAGFSQGGWIAPLAAAKDGGVRSLLIGYGVMVPVTGEDRWGYVYALRQKGFGDDAIARADRLNAIIEDIFDRRQNRWSELREQLDAVRAEPWFDAVKDSDSALGLISGWKYPLWILRAYVSWRMDADPPFIDRLYDPVPTLARLDSPSFWLLAGEDSSAPAEWTTQELDKLRAAGKPIEYHVFPNAEHGIRTFEQKANGERKYLGYEPDFMPRQIEWLRRQSGGPEPASTQ